MRLQRIINLRMSGEDVRWMQVKLKEHGFFKEKITGYFCQNTLVSVTNFQKASGLKPNGVVGSQTWIQLGNFGKKIEVVNNSDIPNKISFASDSGLIIYDNLLSDDEFYKEETTKSTIFIHNTNSCSRPDWRIGNWDKRYDRDNMGFSILEGGQPKQLKTGSHYVIGRKSSSCDDVSWDGKILKAIDDKYYIYHLEAKSSNIKDLNSKSISIEICNYGHLTFRNSQFYNIVNKPIKESDVVELSEPYKGYKILGEIHRCSNRLT
jgi:hypothetical protein